MRRSAPAFVLALAFTPSLALASPPLASPQPATPTIQGGVEAQACQWPTSVTIFNGQGLCSGTLVHPRVVLTAAHCIVPAIGGPPDEVRFGQRTFQPVFSVGVDHCQYNPAYTNGVGPSDYAYCLLDEPVDLPPTPPVMGCEVEQLVKDAPVAIVGFGKLTDANENSAGVKRWGMTTIVSDFAGETVLAGDMDVSSCEGDSGGTGYIQLEDGGWRAFGILSGGPMGCGNYGIYVTMHSMVGWVEEETGIDITPCHDADGAWNPGPDCGGFALSPTDIGQWNQLCPDDLSGPANTCGPGLNDPMELDAPTVTITTPEDGSQFSDIPAAFDISIDADDGAGYAVVRVDLLIDGALAGTLERDAWEDPAPWVFSGAQFNAGEYTLSAQAFDYWGNMGEAQPVAFVVGEVPSETDTGEDESESESESGDAATESEGTSESDSGGDEIGADEAGPLPSDEGCACTTSSRGHGALVLVPLLLVLGRVRRRRASE